MADPTGTPVYSDYQSLVTIHGTSNLNRWANPDGIGAFSVTSLTQSAGIATAVALNPQNTTPGIIAGDIVTISGATPSGYDGTVTVLAATATGFTYAVSSGLTSPATGTVTGQFNVPIGRINYWLLQADAMLNSIFLSGQIFLSPGAYITGGPVALALLNKWATWLASFWLYASARGLLDDDPQGSKLKRDFDEALMQARQCAADKGSTYGFDAVRRWPVSNAATGYCPQPQNAWSGGYGGSPQPFNPRPW